MIPILYDKTETTFASNGLGRLRDTISAVVTEERNGIYELDFEYPVTGAHYDDIQIGRIVGVTHDDTGDIQPFDIVSYTKPIDGVVTFHCTHISYRQSYITVTGSNINSLADAFALFATAEPSNPFSYQTDKTSSGYLASADGIPRTVRQMLGGIEGSVLDAYGGEYEWDKWTVYLHANRGVFRDFSIRYGVNMLGYNDELDSSGTFSSCIPYYANGDEIVVGNKVDSGASTITGRGECVPLDLTEKFENAPTTSDLESEAATYMSTNQTPTPAQTIEVSFVRLQDLGYSEFENLYRCNLCDIINVIFPDYGMSANYKIVKTVWNVLLDRYDEMELGTLSTTLSEALGISETADRNSNTFQNLSVVGDLAVGDDLTVTGDISGADISGTNVTATTQVKAGNSKLTDSGLTIDSHSSMVGKLETSSDSVALSTSIESEVVALELGKGSWIVMFGAQFTANSSGRRTIKLRQASTDISGAQITVTASMSSTNVFLSSCCPVEITSSTNYIRLRAEQNSGSQLNCSGYIRAMRIA